MKSWGLSLGEGPEGLRRHSGALLEAGTYSASNPTTTHFLLTNVGRYHQPAKYY